MISKANNFAYIDGANLHKGIKEDEWKLDYQRFRVWLKEKYGIRRAYLFLGLVPKYKDLYKTLQEQGFTLVFKETIKDGDGNIKGNCDADLVLHAVVDAYENNCSQALIVSGDGDYASLVSFLDKKNRLKAILSPIVYLIDQKLKIEIKNKTPDADKTA